MQQSSHTWLSVLNTSPKAVNAFNSIVTMPYHGVTYAYAKIPSEQFRSLVTHYIHVHRKDENNMADAPARLYPSLETSVVFCRLGNRQCKSFVVGPRDFIRQGEYVTNNTEYFAVLLSQLGGNAILPLAQSELTNQSVPLTEFFPQWSDELTEKIIAAQTTETKIAIFENFVLKHARNFKLLAEDRHILKINKITRTGDCRGYLKYVRDLDYTDRHIRRLFLKYTGIAPKKLFQIMRCQAAIKLMASRPRCNLADIAYQLNYYDQTHFIYEFKTFYNTTPRKFIKDFLAP